MKKTALFSIMMIFMVTAAGCSGNGGDESATDDKRQDVAVTTTFLLDMVEVLDEGADAFDTELIIPAGVDPHTYQPKASNLTTILESDILFYQGLNFEGRMADVLTDGIPVAESFDSASLETEEEGETDPHFWFNIELYKEAMTIVKTELSKASPDHEEKFQANMEAYFRELDELESYVRERLSEVPAESRILITPHDAFGYLSASYDLDVHAPQGFSTASEVSNNTISMTADIIMERDVKSVFVETTTNPDQMRRLEEIVSTRGGTVNVIGSADEALYSDSLGEAGEPGDTYIGMYRHNIDTIVENLK
ncbi:metal ABC transporter solute-binding protein, Zn/Mn family [Salinicoccus carnicancri]|uniref:metal ABC transporter solute-binding protein, Zn/Mn family n=1 Tax=Salinicoccus carnicancri TaxID=558170 RepID=UPI0003127B4A|nr:zinc ABC transporter substrate-binding protein [Salinicoccus carnicancri]